MSVAEKACASVWRGRRLKRGPDTNALQPIPMPCPAFGRFRFSCHPVSSVADVMDWAKPVLLDLHLVGRHLSCRKSVPDSQLSRIYTQFLRNHIELRLDRKIGLGDPKPLIAPHGVLFV